MSNSKETISFRIAPEERAGLDALASSMNRKRSDLIGEALRAYLDVQRWQIEEIGRAIKEADAGDFADEDEVKKTFAKLTK